MTTQTPDFMQEMVDQTRQTFEVGLNATNRMWDAVTRMMTGPVCMPTRFEDFRGCNERFNRQFTPVVKDNFDTFNSAVNTQMRNNLEFFKRSMDKAQSGSKDFNWTGYAQDTLKDAFGTVRCGLDLAGETSTKVMKNWMSLFTECGEKCESKAAPAKPMK